MELNLLKRFIQNETGGIYLMSRIYNFSAGPSTLPEPVLARAASEMLEYGSSGQSVMEMSHRSPEYEAIIADCEKRLRRVMQIPDNYKVLFIQGGASMQFSMIPMNLLTGSGRADYVVSGVFSKKAYEEAAGFGEITVAASGKDSGFSKLPDLSAVTFDSKADYVHICQNNTIYGTYFKDLPDTGSVPLAADLSSCILSEPVDVSKYGLIYAGAQKNIGPAGLCVVIIREDLIGDTLPGTPTMLQYKTYSENDSMYNTPPTYAIYIMGMVLGWIQDEMGGLEGMKAHNQKKAAILYNYLDESSLFKPGADKSSRSMMNVTFVTGSAELDKTFCQQAQKAGFFNLKGHRLVGGMRASIYNAVPVEGVEKLVAFMKKFETENK